MKQPDADVIIIGGGLAGFSCAVRLVDEKKKVLLLEARSVIGGRTSSWIERGMHVESGFHRFLGFYEHQPELLKRVGIDLDSMLVWEDEAQIRMPDGETADFGLSLLHKPLKSVGSVTLNNDFLPPAEKMKLAAFFSDGFLKLKTDPSLLDTKTVQSFAIDHGIDERVITRVLVPLTEGLFFLSIKKYSAFNFFALFAPYLTKLYKVRVGGFAGGMTEVMMQPMQKYIESRTGTVEVDAKVTDVIAEHNAIEGVIVDGKTISTPCVERIVDCYGFITESISKLDD